VVKRETHKRLNAKAKVRVTCLIAVEGIKIKAKAIPKRQLVSVWKELTSKPFPKVKAFQLKDNDFDRVICLRRCEEDEIRELTEWNTILTTEGTDACVFNAEEISGLEYAILIRENPYHSIGEIIEHELSHVAKGDL
jgi:hypothetical protein